MYLGMSKLFRGIRNLSIVVFEDFVIKLSFLLDIYKALLELFLPDGFRFLFLVLRYESSMV